MLIGNSTGKLGRNRPAEEKMDKGVRRGQPGIPGHGRREPVGSNSQLSSLRFLCCEKRGEPNVELFGNPTK